MSVVVIGVNQRSIPIDDFEKLAIDDERLPKLFDDLTASEDISEAVVLSTCNRTEIYIRAERFHPAYGDVRDALARHSGLATMAFTDHLYAHHDADAARHLFGVASGLDSAVLGETEILGQVRTAYDKAHTAGVVGPSLAKLFSASCTAGRKVRASTGIARNITSVSRAAVAMATHALGTLDGKAICVLGAGEMSEGMTVALRDAGTRRIVICNRTVERAAGLAERVGGDVAPLSDLASVIEDVDVLLTGTGANALMIDHGTFCSLHGRSDRGESRAAGRCVPTRRRGAARGRTGPHWKLGRRGHQGPDRRRHKGAAQQTAASSYVAASRFGRDSTRRTVS